MAPSLKIMLVSWASILLPIAVSIAIALASKPTSALLRLALAVLMAWAFSVGFAIAVYNPVMITAGQALGQHCPECVYDNNVTGIAILAGWLWPLFAALIALSVKAISRRARQVPQ